MPQVKRFNLLIAKGDSSRILSVRLPRWAAWLAVGLVGLAVGSLGAIYNDYLTLRHQRATLSSLGPRLAEQQVLLEAYQTKVREVWAEIDGWRELHAKIWEPFGPEAGPVMRTRDIGGGTASNPFDVEPDGSAVKEELRRLTSAVREEGENLRSLERFLGRAGKVLASLPSRWPLRGPVNSDFGRRLSPWAPNSEFHGGMDIGAPIGAPVHAPAPGTVVFAGRHPEYGVTMIIDHGNEIKSIYAHLSKLGVALNQKVRRGDVIAYSGNTGRSSGPHLHYEIQVKGQPVNPNSYIWE